jgi:mono/diheme cytochrome c family protein
MKALSGMMRLAVLAGLLARPGPVRAASAPAALEYNRDVRPILSDNCFQCHGPDRNQRKGGLRLDIRDEALKPAKSGKAAIQPGKADASELVRRILTTDDDDHMPPAETRKNLTAAQRDILKRWVAEGAAYQPHWAYIPPKRTAPPVGSVKNPIDGFILAKLREHHTALSPEADRRTLLRRLSFDLVGLPPTPEEMDAFLKDGSSKAYERQVERLLRSPHYGERMASPWMDLVRFADTVGYHGDQNIDVFPYRDYLIASFNRNKPFDQFTREQLAGDLLPNPTEEARVATAFNRLNMVTREGGAQPGEYLAKYAADRVRTVAMTWMGATLGCCECHDHKFDPFTSRDFYSLEAFFADVKQWGVYQDYDYTPNPDLKGWSNDHPFPPEIEVESPNLVKRAEVKAAEIEARVADAAARVRSGAARASFSAWADETRAYLARHPGGWAVPDITDSKGDTNVSLASGDIVFKGRPKGGWAVLNLRAGAGRVSAVRVELVPKGTNGVTSDGGMTRVETRFAVRRKGGEAKDAPIRFADATIKEPLYENGHELLGVVDGWRTSLARPGARHAAVYVFDTPIDLGADDVLQVRLSPGAVRRVRLDVTPLAALNPLASGANAELGEGFSRAGGEPTDALVRAWVLNSPGEGEARAKLVADHQAWLALRSGRAPVVVTTAWKPRVTRVLARGNWMDESGAVVTPATPASLPPGGLPRDRRLNRLDLANWLTAPDNPLVSRAVMNRLWKQFFGNALALQVEDLGAQGEPPSHPELLDWLAVEFRESGWDLRHMVKLIVTSDTYRQSSNWRPDLREIDPNNRWLSAQNPRRLEAEFVRDNALAISGLLDDEIGGPSVFPYQPAGYYANIQFPDREYIASEGGDQHRRGLYTHWQRTFLHPMLANFDAPSREECTASRPVSNTPQQALTLLNDPSFAEAAAAFGARLAATPGDDAARFEAAWRRALGRPPKPAELAEMKNFVAGQRAHYKEHADEAVKLCGGKDGASAELSERAAWVQAARVVLNLHETITRY